MSHSIWLFFCSVFLLSCIVTSKSESPEILNTNDLEYLKTIINADAFVFCDLYKTASIAMPVRNASLFWHNGNPVLSYEGVFREGVRSVWQTLNGSNFDFKDDGVIIGKKGITYTVDFKSFTDVFGGFWTYYRYKVPSTESFGAMFEYLPADKKSQPINRMIIQPEPDTTVQKIWLMNQVKWERDAPQSMNGLAYLVVRLASTVKLEEYDQNDTYVLYSYNHKKNELKKVAISNPKLEGFVADNFLFSPNSEMPVAIGIKRNSIDEYSLSKKIPIAKNKITVKNIFEKASNETVLLERDGMINSFISYSPSNSVDNLYLAWIKFYENKPNPELQTLYVNLNALISQRVSDKNVFKKQLSYVPSGLGFENFEASAKILLTWWGGVEDNQALSLMPFKYLSNKAKNSEDKSAKSAKTVSFLSNMRLGVPASFKVGKNNEIYLVFNNKSQNNNKTNLNFCRASTESLVNILR